MHNRYSTYQFKNIVFGIVFISTSLNAMRFSKEEKRDWEIASNAITAHNYLNKICQTSAILTRVNRELDEKMPQKKVYTALIKRLDLLSEGLANILDSDNLVSCLIPRNDFERESCNATISTHHKILSGLVDRARQEYPVLISLAKKQIDDENKIQKRMHFEHSTKTELISTEAHGNFQNRMENYNGAHEALYKALQELHESLPLRVKLDEATAHLNAENKISYNELAFLTRVLHVKADRIKESAQDCYEFEATRIANIAKTKKNELKIRTQMKNVNDAQQQLNEIKKRTIVPRIITKQLLCPTPLSFFEYDSEKLKIALHDLPFNGKVKVKLEVIMTGDKPGTIRTLIFFADKSQEMAIKPAYVTLVNQLKLTTDDFDILIPFETDKSVCQIAQAETGDCYLSTNGADFYKASHIIGLIESDPSKTGLPS